MRGLAFSSAIAIATALGGFQAALAAEPQQAQDATAANQPQQSEGLSDIIVTAQKRAEPLQSVPSPFPHSAMTRFKRPASMA